MGLTRGVQGLLGKFHVFGQGESVLRFIFVRHTPQKTNMTMEISLFYLFLIGGYIFKWLFCHCHVSFQGSKPNPAGLAVWFFTEKSLGIFGLRTDVCLVFLRLYEALKL